jgi:hypothetical protein
VAWDVEFTEEFREWGNSLTEEQQDDVAVDVEFTEEFREWGNSLTEEQQDDVAVSVRHLIEFGPALGFPHSSRITTSEMHRCASCEPRAVGNRCGRYTGLTRPEWRFA